LFTAGHCHGSIRSTLAAATVPEAVTGDGSFGPPEMSKMRLEAAYCATDR